jgi:hypothetical protein
MNGQNRHKSQPLSNSFATVDLYPDTYYDYSLNQPRDDTIVGSGPEVRNTEWQINNATIGPDTGDFRRSIFPGAHIQVFPTDKIKIEPWFMNGLLDLRQVEQEQLSGAVQPSAAARESRLRRQLLPRYPYQGRSASQAISPR